MQDRYRQLGKTLLRRTAGPYMRVKERNRFRRRSLREGIALYAMGASPVFPAHLDWPGRA